MRSPFRWGKLAAIFISHMHGDHLNGLPGLLGTLSLNDFPHPLKLFGPPGLLKYLEVLKSTKVLWVNFPLEAKEITQSGVLLETETYQVETAPLNHVIECWGYVFKEKPRPGTFNAEKADKIGIPPGPLRAKLVKGETITLPNGQEIQPQELVGSPKPGKSFSHCLDTKPCRNVETLSQGVDLLLHEATFAEELQKEAHHWGHSTAADAAKGAKEANSKRLILTHVSQRYQSGDILLEEAGEVFSNTELAEDLKEFEI
jgi:ribonuclease Z